ncbi:hypothetical protein DGI_3086 [Megalodesulfovibrio gigas DSM 1382 = ATCC 19364]|uniref:Uncharacterized protein n=2 Tax=Megalodesulfovibrio gigas TaxID=879 RepID=T2GF53_MEGG1|nr:unknown [Megalodesulfovibrio gigas]AGW14804.1 hypothetical protein DGI_3086 [Megalodesulfovibrio gigas DSM 1382 = ATCC 19364]
MHWSRLGEPAASISAKLLQRLSCSEGPHWLEKPPPPVVPSNMMQRERKVERLIWGEAPMASSPGVGDACCADAEAAMTSSHKDAAKKVLGNRMINLPKRGVGNRNGAQAPIINALAARSKSFGGDCAIFADRTFA